MRRLLSIEPARRLVSAMRHRRVGRAIDPVHDATPEATPDAGARGPCRPASAESIVSACVAMPHAFLHIEAVADAESSADNGRIACSG